MTDNAAPHRDVKYGSDKDGPQRRYQTVNRIKKIGRRIHRKEKSVEEKSDQAPEKQLFMTRVQRENCDEEERHCCHDKNKRRQRDSPVLSSLFDDEIVKNRGSEHVDRNECQNDETKRLEQPLWIKDRRIFSDVTREFRSLLQELVRSAFPISKSVPETYTLVDTAPDILAFNIRFPAA